MRLKGRISLEMARVEGAGLRRDLLLLEGATGPVARLGGESLVNLCSNDYLSLAADPRLIEAAAASARTYGAGAGASRLLTGNLPCHEELEEAVAAFLGYEAALLFGSGYHANTGLIPALAGEGDLILSDELNHASIIDGCRLSPARRLIYRHRDLNHLEDHLKQDRGDASLALVITESIFSMDGDAPDLTALADLCRRYDAALLVDEAHAIGVAGEGRGLVAALRLQERVDMVVGTFGKALGAFGAFVAGSRPLRELLINKARSVIFSTAPSPADVGAAREGLRIVETQGKELTAKLAGNTRALVDALQSAGFPVPEPAGAIVPLLFGDEKEAQNAAKRLAAAGVLARAIRPPAVPPGGSRLRLTACAGHSPQNLKTISDAFAAH